MGSDSAVVLDRRVVNNNSRNRVVNVSRGSVVRSSRLRSSSLVRNPWACSPTQGAFFSPHSRVHYIFAFIFGYLPDMN